MRVLRVVIVLVSLAAASAASARTVAQNRALARRQASALLATLRLPPGTARVKTPPAGTGRFLRAEGLHVLTSALVDRHALWLGPGTVSSVRGYVEAHLAPGGDEIASGLDAGPGVRANIFIDISFPTGSGVQSRDLVVTIADAGNGRVGVRADAEVVYTVPRAVSERVPAGVREIDVTRGLLGDAPSTRAIVVSARAIRAITRLIDAAPVVQPGVWSCPSEPVHPLQVTLTFRSRTGAALARAWGDATEPATPCQPLSFSVRGRLEPALLPTDAALDRIQRLVGLRLWAKPRR